MVSNCQYSLPCSQRCTGATSIIWFVAGKRLYMAYLPLPLKRLFLLFLTTEIYEPGWHLSYGVVWMRRLSHQFISEGFSWLFLAWVGFSKALRLSQQFLLYIPFFAQWRTWWRDKMQDTLQCICENISLLFQQYIALIQM